MADLDVLRAAQMLVVTTFVRPSLYEAAQLVIMAAGWCAAQWLTVEAYRRAEASTLAPFAYTQLMFATVLGAAVFGQWPDAIAIAGILLILCCGAAAAWEAARRVGLRATEEEAVR